MKNLILVRGVPGSGKTTFANMIAPANISADQYFDKFHNGEFDASLLSKAHQWCLQSTMEMMGFEISIIAVHNTFTQEWEMTKYYELAETFGYTVSSVIVENRHGNKSVHNVPEETVLKMRNRFDISL